MIPSSCSPAHRRTCWSVGLQDHDSDRADMCHVMPFCLWVSCVGPRGSPDLWGFCGPHGRPGRLPRRPLRWAAWAGRQLLASGSRSDTDLLHPDANRALTPYPVPPTRPHRRPLTRMRHCAARSRRLSRRHEPLTALAESLLRPRMTGVERLSQCHRLAVTDGPDHRGTVQVVEPLGRSLPNRGGCAIDQSLERWCPDFPDLRIGAAGQARTVGSGSDSKGSRRRRDSRRDICGCVSNGRHGIRACSVWPFTLVGHFQRVWRRCAGAVAADHGQS
jgi:hypothetical protein